MNSTRTIDSLLQIMNDPAHFTSRRIEAAEAVLGFEAPTEAVNRARDYLVSVFENEDEEAIRDRMAALQIARKFEARKITPQTVQMTRREEADRREAWREYEIRQRRTKLIMATRQIPPPNYADDLRSSDYLPPPGSDWPPSDRTADGRLKLDKFGIKR